MGNPVLGLEAAQANITRPLAFLWLSGFGNKFHPATVKLGAATFVFQGADLADYCTRVTN